MRASSAGAELLNEGRQAGLWEELLLVATGGNNGTRAAGSRRQRNPAMRVGQRGEETGVDRLVGPARDGNKKTIQHLSGRSGVITRTDMGICSQRFVHFWRSSGSCPRPVSPDLQICTMEKPSGGEKLHRIFHFFWASAPVDLEAALSTFHHKWFWYMQI